MRETTKAVQDVFFEGLLKILEEKLEEQRHYLIAGTWDSFEQGQARVLTIRSIEEIKRDFRSVYDSCYGK